MTTLNSLLNKGVLAAVAASLAFALGGAHFWRAGYPALSVVCACMPPLIWSRQAWVRFVVCAALPLLAARWIWAAAQFVQIRQMMGAPWTRLAAILWGVSLFTALAAWLVHRSGRDGESAGFFRNRPESAAVSAAAFTLTFSALAAIHAAAPQLLLLNRFFAEWGLAQAFVLGVWAAWVAAGLSRKEEAPALRMRVWRLFSVVFFAQLALGLAGHTQFLMTGQVHPPVPGLILAAPIYRGYGFFMLGLFAVSVALAGAAWCSHLCYLGAWDVTAAQRRKGAPSPPNWLRRGSFAAFCLVPAAALALRLSGVPTMAAVTMGLLLGLLIIPTALLVSRRYGISGYCAGLCPLGFAATRLGRLAPWRIRISETCTGCLRCARVCRHNALNDPAVRAGRPDAGCVLCRDCLTACPHGACEMRFAGLELKKGTAEKIFVFLISSLHALFLGVAMV